jgi:hypothetical protein
LDKITGAAGKGYWIFDHGAGASGPINFNPTFDPFRRTAMLA